MARMTRWFVFSLQVGIFACLLGVMLAHPAATARNSQATKHVLVLHSFRTILPAQVEIDQVLRATLQAESPFPVDIDIESLDLERFKEAPYIDELSSLLRRKYAHRRLDVIIPVFGPALTFMLKHGESIFPGIPVVFTAEFEKPLQNLPLRPHMTGAYAKCDFAANLQLALTFAPQTRQVLVVGGTAPLDRVFLSHAQEALRPYDGQVELTYLTDLAVEELQERVAQLPPHTIIYYITVLRDSKDRELVPHAVLKSVAGAANVPVYGLFETLLGEGIVGGSLVDFREQGRLAGELAARILKGEKPEQLPPVLARNRLLFDWRQLNRWGISEDKLPPDSLVRYREQTLWELYRGWIIGFLVLLGLQSALIGALLINRASRRRAEQGLGERLRFEEVLSELSAAFINFSGDRGDQEIDTCLNRVLQSLKIDRISVLEFSDDANQLKTRHFSTAHGLPGISLYIPTENLPWFTKNIAAGRTMKYARLPDDLPAEAVQEKEYCRQEGLKSILSLPLQVVGSVLGVINFSTMQEHVDWSRYPVNRLNLVAEIFGNAILRRRTQQILEDRLGFEELMTELSAAFVSLPAARVDSEIKLWHGRVADFLKVERSIIPLFSPDKKELLPLSSLTGAGIPPDFRSITPEVLPWYFEQAYQGKTLVLPHLPEDLPGELPKEKDYCLRTGLKSFVSVPLAVGGEVLGALTMGFFSHYVSWPAHLIRRLGLLGEVFANALMRQRAAENLKECEQSYRIVADFTYDWEYWENPDGSLRYVSPACERISGYRVEEFLSRPQLLREIIVPEDRQIWDDHQDEIQQAPAYHEIQFRLRRPDGDIRWIEHVCQPVKGSRGEFLGFRASNRDITARKHIEIQEQQHREELARVGRVAILSELTGALAHEIIQPLMAIMTNSQAARRLLDNPDPDLGEVKETLEDITRGSERASSVIQQLRQHLKPGPPEFARLDLNDLVQSLIPLVSRQAIINNINLVCELTKGLPPIAGNHIQLEQVILNLVVNGIEAIKGSADGPREIVLQTTREDADTLRVSVMDSGPGIKPEDLKLLFDPFFTTKKEGMGLGLSISRSIVKAHKGKLWAAPNPGRGTTLHFTLPVFQEKP